jgi:serine/threonine protein kinase
LPDGRVSRGAGGGEEDGTVGADEGRLVAGRYRLVERIGRGGMGTVWRAVDELLGRQVAVKKLHPRPQLDDRELATLHERTRREARAAARISHPCVVVVHDVVEDDGVPVIVMEYVPAATLADLVTRDGSLPPAEAARIGRAMLAALRAAHAAGVLHRDVKPGNVLLGAEGRVVLTDFGIAQASGTSTLTRTGELIGSIDFLSPERLTGGRQPGPEADLWALGATLYQAVEGRSPFRRSTAIETAWAIAHEDPPPPRAAGPLAPLIAGLLERDPERRLTAEQAERMLRDEAAEPDTAWHEAGHPAGSAGQGPTAPTTQLPRPPAATGDATGYAAGHSTGNASTHVTGNASAHVTGNASAHVNDHPPAHANDNPYEPVHPTPYPAPTAPHSNEPPTARTPHPAPPHPATPYPAHTPGPPAAYRDARTAGPARRRRTAGWVAAAAALVLAAGAAALTLRPGGHHPDAGPTAKPTGGASHASRTPTPTPTPSGPDPAATGAPPPAGSHLATESALGFAVTVPDGWTRTVKASSQEVDYVSPDGLTGLRVDIEDYAGSDHYQHFQQVEQQTRTRVDDYQRMRMNRTRWRDRPAAVWEFSFQGTARQWRAIDIAFSGDAAHGNGDREYAVYLSAPSASWATALPVFNTAVAGFRLT